MSYTTFKYANLRANRRQMAKDGEATVSVDVTSDIQASTTVNVE